FFLSTLPTDISPLSLHDALPISTLGIAQIGLGFIFLTIGGRLIPAGEVALITLLEIVLGPLWVWLFLSEGPSAATLAGGAIVLGDRKSTRLNSSHGSISYAVFCL